MGRHEDKSKAAGIYRTGGREYVSISEAARRLGRTRQAISGQVRSGRLDVKDFSSKGVSGKWLLWDKVKEFYAAIDSRKKEKGQSSNEGELPDLGDGTLRLIENPPREIPMLVDTEDPENSDCWKKFSNGVYCLDEMGRHVIDYEKYKQKWDALIRKQQYEREAGRLVPKDIVDQALSKSLSPLTTSIMQIPDRFASRIVGLVESIVGSKLGNEQRTTLRALLEDESESIVVTLRRNVEEALDGIEG